jgi:protein transport protein SEC24
VNPVDDRERIDAFLDKLLAMYYTDARKNMPIETCSGSAMTACT